MEDAEQLQYLLSVTEQLESLKGTKLLEKVKAVLPLVLRYSSRLVVLTL